MTKTSGTMAREPAREPRQGHSQLGRGLRAGQATATDEPTNPPSPPRRTGLPTPDLQLEPTLGLVRVHTGHLETMPNEITLL